MLDKIEIELVAKSAKFKKGMDEAAEKTKETTGEVDKAKSKFDRFSEKMGALSPTFAKMSKDWKERSEGISSAFGGGAKAAKLMKLGIIGVVAAVGIKLAQAIHRVASEWAAMFDPQAFAKAESQYKKAVKRLKTSLGSLVSPLVNGVNSGLAKVVDALNWVVERVVAYVAYIKGFINAIASALGFNKVFKSATEKAQETADAMGEVVDATSAGLASFDKLNTLDMSNAGDSVQAERLKEIMDEWQAKGEGIFEDWGNLLDGFGFDVSGIWDDFKDGVLGGYDTLKKTIGKWFDDAGGKISTLWANFRSGCSNAWANFKTWASDAWGNAKETAVKKWNEISTKISEVWTGFSTTASKAWEDMKSTATEKWNEISIKITGIWGDFQSAAEKAWNAITGFANRFLEDVLNPILDKFKNMLGLGSGGGSSTGGKDGDGTPTVSSSGHATFTPNQSWKPGEALGTIVGGTNNTFIGKLASAGQKVQSTLVSAGKSLVSGVKGFLGLAGGGGIAPNNPMPYILGDNKREYEVVSPVSLIEKAVMSAMSKMGSTGAASTGPIELTVNLDGRKVARQIYDPLQTESRRRGSTI